MTLRLSLLLPVALAVACARAATPLSPEPLPNWLTSLISELESQPRASPPASIGRYEYKGEIVYFLPQRCCDIRSNVYRLDGTILCHPDGGITGAGDGRCQDFFAERKNERIVWRDPR